MRERKAGKAIQRREAALRGMESNATAECKKLENMTSIKEAGIEIVVQSLLLCQTLFFAAFKAWAN